MTRVLEAVIAQRGTPQGVRSDNGPELASRHYLVWFAERKIAAIHNQAGKPTQNGHVESFHGKLRGVFECELVLELVGCTTKDRDLASTTIRAGRIRSWATGHRKSSQRCALRVNPVLGRGKESQTPIPCPTPGTHLDRTANRSKLSYARINRF